MKSNGQILSGGLITLLLAGCSSFGGEAPPKPGFSDHWQLVWNDEFNGTALDASKWTHEQNCWGGGNQEQQCYVADDKNAFVADGILTIRAIKEETTGPNQMEGAPGYGETLVTLPYSSARLRTVNKGDWQYGRFEIRAKLPAGQGTWPAVWMLPTDWVYGGWASSGEIDIVESVNLGTTYQSNGLTRKENRIHGTLHFGKAWPGNVQAGVPYDFANEAINPADNFHTYAIEWEQDEIRWYVDDIHYATQTSNGWWSQYQDQSGNWISGPKDAPYNQKFHLILNLAMGGTWPSSVNHRGIDSSIHQVDMQVDYVRVYQCRVSPETGKGCATPASNTAVRHPGVVEPPFPADIDLSGQKISLFEHGTLLPGLHLNGWDDAANDARTVAGDAIEIAIEGNGNAYLESVGKPLDMRAFAGGELSFDLAVVSGSADGLSVKMDSGYPALAPITMPIAQLPEPGVWQQYNFPIAKFIASGINGFTLERIVNPLVFEPVNNRNLTFRIRNITFTKL